MRYLFFVLASLFLTKLAMAASDPSQFTQDDEAFGSTTATGTALAAQPASGGSNGSIVGQIDSSDPNYVPPQAKAPQMSAQAMCEATGKSPAVCVCELQIKFQKEQALCLTAAMDPDVAKLANSVSATNKYASQYRSGSTAKAGAAAPGGSTSIDDIAMKMATEILGGSSPAAAQPTTTPQTDSNMSMLMNLLMMGGMGGSSGAGTQGYTDPNAGAAPADPNGSQTTTDNGASFY